MLECQTTSNKMPWSPFHLCFFFHCNSNSMDIPFCSCLFSNEVIITSCAVMACAKICCDLMTSGWITARRNFHRIWIASKMPLVKWSPGLISFPALARYFSEWADHSYHWADNFSRLIINTEIIYHWVPYIISTAQYIYNTILYHRLGLSFGHCLCCLVSW